MPANAIPTFLRVVVREEPTTTPQSERMADQAEERPVLLALLALGLPASETVVAQAIRAPRTMVAVAAVERMQ
jgi:hypothetical protein